jgi:HlyD family secretion protein
MIRKYAVAIVLGVVAVAGVAVGVYWWRTRHTEALPSYIVQTNGRLEFARVDVAVKYPGRIVELHVHEGDRAAEGQILAREDSAELNAQLAGARAQHAQAMDGISRAQAQLDAHRSGEALARLEVTQTEGLHEKKFVSDVELQRRHLALSEQIAGVAAATAALAQARTALQLTAAEISRLEAMLGETSIRAPIAGRIEYKIIERGAVLPAGGRVATLVDPTDVYMTVFVGSKVAAKLSVGAEARIVLDGLEDQPFVAVVSFISPEAQFTPKYVETASERDKLVYRVKLQIPNAVAARYDGQLKAGATGNGYLRLQTQAAWPGALAIRGTEAPTR